jgi:acyl-CoA thioester hydrolase
MAYQDFTFFHTLRVRFVEVDMQAVVFNGHFLTYFDVALTEYWRTVKLPSPIEQAKDGCEFFVKKATLEYHAPAKFDDLLDIGVRTCKVGNSSLVIFLEIYRTTQLIVSGEMVYVYFNTQEAKSISIPARWIEMLSDFEKNTALQKIIN